VLGHAFERFFPFAGKGSSGGKIVRLKKGKEAAKSIALALATGGAGAAGKAIMEKVGEKAAEKGIEKKVAEKGMEKKIEKKAGDAAKKKGKDKSLDELKKEAYDKKKKKAMIEEEEKKMGLGGVPPEEPDDEREKIVFERLWKKGGSRDQKKKSKILYEYIEAGAITKEESNLIIESEIGSNELKLMLRTKTYPSQVLIKIAGQIGSSRAEKLFSDLGFETETEVAPARKPGGRKGGKVLDVVARCNQSRRINFDTVDVNGRIFTKEENIDSATIVGIESKSYMAKSFGYRDSLNHLKAQIDNSVGSGNVGKTYAYLSSDFKEVPIKRRIEIREMIEKAGGEIMISKFHSKDNYRSASRILKKIQR
jgi:hypothetical protein